MTSLFELFKIGIGPSSSHTVAPMRAALAFLRGLQRGKVFDRVARVRIDLYGSPTLPVTLSEAGLTLECGPNRHPLLASFALFKPRHWIYLRPVAAGP